MLEPAVAYLVERTKRSRVLVTSVLAFLLGGWHGHCAVVQPGC